MSVLRPLSRLALAICVGISASTAAANQQDTLLGVVQETLDSNPELQTQLNAFYASTEDRRQAFGGYLPSVDITTSIGQANRQYDNRSDYSRNYAEIALTQMLFDGFKVRSALARAEHTSQARYFDLMDEAEQKTLEAAEAYLSVLRHRQLVKLAQTNVANHQRVQVHVNERAQRGVSNRADLNQINGRLSLARSNLITEVTNLQSVTARFQRLVGRLPAQELEAVELPADLLPTELEPVLETVYANNPGLYAAFANTRAAEAALSEAKSTRYPTLELGLRHGIYKNNNSFDNRTDPDSYGDENIIELRTRYNLYRGGSDRAAERAAYHRINQAESLRDKACVDLRQTATISYAETLHLKEKLISLASHRDDAANVVVAYREQFDIGRRSLLDVLDSENEMFQAERAYVNGYYDLQINQLYTLRSMGRLMDTLTPEAEMSPDLGSFNVTPSPFSNRYCSVDPAAVLEVESYLAPLKAQETVGLSGDALFDTGSAQLRPTALAGLESFAQQLLAEGTASMINIVGHTDSTGSAATNRELSLARAIAVRDFLVEKGVDSTILAVSGIGSDQPIASNATAEGRSQNRRVELHVKRM